MSTDLGLVSQREGRAAQAQAQTEITMMLVFVIITLAMLVLLFADQSFSKATIELMCLFLKDSSSWVTKCHQRGIASATILKSLDS